MNNHNKNQNNRQNLIYNNIKSEFKPKSYNGIFITLLTILYVLFTNKLAEIFSNSNNDESQIASYVMTLYFINIMSLVVAFIWLTKENNGNYVLRKSLTYGSIIMLVYSILNYWEFLDDYAKLIMLSLAISCIVYYAY